MDLGKEASRHNPRRRNKDVIKAAELAVASEDAPDDGQMWMEPKAEWSDEVKAIFMAMQTDPMRQFMTPLGWAQLYLKCSAWDREFKPKFLGITNDGDVKMGRAPLPGAVLADITKTLDSFGGSEKSRREMKILLDPDPDAGQAQLGGDAKMAAKDAIARPAKRSLGR
ncbi:UNVERIFIED_CONTAM: hypothetical protein IGO34_23050 [Salmonella enterica subsp. enterica serovar Weltevreden]